MDIFSTPAAEIFALGNPPTFRQVYAIRLMRDKLMRASVQRRHPNIGSPQDTRVSLPRGAEGDAWGDGVRG